MRSSPDGPELQRIYGARFAGKTDYRTGIWRVLASYFAPWFPSAGSVLDLGAGYCEFINNAAGGMHYRYGRGRASTVFEKQSTCHGSWRTVRSGLTTNGPVGRQKLPSDGRHRYTWSVVTNAG